MVNQNGMIFGEEAKLSGREETSDGWLSSSSKEVDTSSGQVEKAEG